MPKGELNFVAKLKRLKCSGEGQQEVRMKNHNNSLFEMNYVRRKCKTIIAGCLK